MTKSAALLGSVVTGVPRVYGTLTVDGGLIDTVGVGMTTRSPNVRLERPTKKDFDQLRRWVVDELDVGQRAVTIDILAAAMQEVARAHPKELLAAVRKQRVQRAKEQ